MMIHLEIELPSVTAAPYSRCTTVRYSQSTIPRHSPRRSKSHVPLRTTSVLHHGTLDSHGITSRVDSTSIHVWNHETTHYIYIYIGLKSNDTTVDAQEWFLFHLVIRCNSWDSSSNIRSDDCKCAKKCFDFA